MSTRMRACLLMTPLRSTRTAARLLFVATFALAGCASLLGVDDVGYGGDAGTSDSSSGTPDSFVDPGRDGDTTTDATNDGGAETSCEAITEDVTLAADTMIAEGSCHGSIHRGADLWVNVGVVINSKGLFRFQLSAAQSRALATGAVKGYSLTITRCTPVVDPACDNSVSRAGTMLLSPMRTDWIEGAAPNNYNGADWCRRMSGSTGMDWSAPGASAVPADVSSSTVASVAINAAQPNVTFSMTAVDAIAERASAGPYSEISLQMVPTNGAVFLMRTKEGATATFPAPKLTITYCPVPPDAGADAAGDVRAQ